MIEREGDSTRSIPAQTAAEACAEIGPILRAARLKRGQSLEAVARQTRIPKRYLDSLENDRFDDFPAAVYMRGFLKGYCEHIDVSFDELWSHLHPPKAEAPPAPGAAAAALKPVDGPATPGASATGAVLLALSLAAGLGVVLFKDRRPAPVAGSQEATPRALLPLPRATEPRVGLRALEDAWVRVTVDDGVAFEGRLPRDGALDWKPARSVSLRTTAPDSLRLTVNGATQALANPTPDGEYRIEIQ